jgi:hypothetical protein
VLADGAGGGQFGPGVYAGLLGRLMLLSYLGWILTVTAAVRRVDASA